MTDHDDDKWKYLPHTRAKHQILGKYLNAWYPILSKWNGRIFFLDGFAGRGRYADGSEGSPLIALRHLVDHRWWPEMSHRDFSFMFVENDKENVVSLQKEIDAFKAAHAPWPDNVKTQVVHGPFDKTATGIIDHLRARNARLAPTFAFVDPFGYSGLPMTLLGELLAYPRTELFVNFMVGHVQRFIERDGQEHAMRSLFGIEVEDIFADWNPHDVGRVDHLREVYERQLKAVAGFDYVRSFRMDNVTGNAGYYLVHGTRHRNGVKAMKSAMWSVDPAGSYQFSDKTAGVDVLFEAAPQLGPLRKAIVQNYHGQRGVRIEDIEWFAVLDTSYRETHVRSVLTPLEREGKITVHRAGARAFPPGKTTIDFT